MKGPSPQWEVMTGLSPETSHFLRGDLDHPRGLKLWSCLSEGNHLFIALPIGHIPAGVDGAHHSIHEALQAVGRR